MRAFKTFLIVKLLIVSLGLSTALYSQDVELDSLDAYISRSMQEWQVPGVAVAIIHKDTLRFAKGFGIRAIGKKGDVNDHTLFAVASNSKAFTATLLGMLVDQGRLRWDDRVVDYLPDFQLYDSYVSREIRIADLLSHRGGLPVFGGDHLWIGAPKNTREDIVRRMRYLEPTAPFRMRYQYNNLMFLVAGQVYTAITGDNWEDAVEAKIFEPIGMTESKTNVMTIQDYPNMARPHEKVQDKVQMVAFDDVDNVAPAAAVVSNVLDMVEWMRFNMNGGMVGETRLVSEKVMRQMHAMHTPIPVSKSLEELLGTQFLGYGLGWVVADYKGRKTMGHSGGLSGMISLQTMIPSEQLGVIVLTNYAPGRLIRAITYRILDAYLGVKDETDWSRVYLERKQKSEETRMEREKDLQRKRIKKTKPSLKAKDYFGVYSSSLSGDASIRSMDGKLWFYYNERHTGWLEHWHHDVYRVHWQNPIFDMPNKSFLQFFLNTEGRVSHLEVTFYDPQTFYYKTATEE
ncbi:MAG: serine hydrolase [Calditrichia bacterium]